MSAISTNVEAGLVKYANVSQLRHYWHLREHIVSRQIIGNPVCLEDSNASSRHTSQSSRAVNLRMLFYARSRLPTIVLACKAISARHLS